ncbi:MAG: two-component system response regulator OmpR [Betaproteobacteria bacterium]|nr:two-component system response regulator OmpR [Betaproteobacteria bacterium]
MNTAPAPRHRILVVDDDLRLRDLLKRYLTEQGFAVETLPDGAGLERAFARNRFDLMVLDVMLPGEDGTAILRKLRGAARAEANLPVIMLTAKGDDVDRIVGLEMGADDYVAKPFNPRELVARIHAVLRRQAPLEAPGAPAASDEVVTFGPYALNIGTRSLTRDGRPVAMTTGEFGLLKVLAQHPRVPLSRDKLTEIARGREHETFDRAIDVQVSRLRKLLGEDPQHPRFIQTVWGLGYVFVPDGSPHAK